MCIYVRCWHNPACINGRMQVFLHALIPMHLGVLCGVYLRARLFAKVHDVYGHVCFRCVCLCLCFWDLPESRTKSIDVYRVCPSDPPCVCICMYACMYVGARATCNNACISVHMYTCILTRSVYRLPYRRGCSVSQQSATSSHVRQV